MENVVIIAVLIAVISLSVGYIIKTKKNGGKCIGCPSGHECERCNCGCNEHK